MLWKRLNDMGKNWRHVYKGLLLLEYILKTGADHIVGEVLKNKFAIQTLLDFRYVDSRGVDKGMNVREQAKVQQLSCLSYRVCVFQILELRERSVFGMGSK